MANVTFVLGAVDNASGVLGKVHNALGNILQITAGNLIADGIRRITGAVMDMGGEIIRGASVFQNLELKYTNMVARIMAADATRNAVTTVYSQERIQLSAEEAGALEKVQRKYDIAIAQLPVMQERLQAMADSGNYSAAAMELQSVKIQQLQSDIAAMGGQIDGYQAKSGALVEVATQLQTATYYTADFIDKARTPAKELLDWVLGVALQSKFTAESLSQVMGFALSMKMPPDIEKGLSSLDRAKELVMAVGNFSAGMGLDNTAIERIMYNFTQMSAAGKVTGRDLRDLATSLFPANDAFDTMAQMMGITRVEAEKLAKSGEIDVTKFFDAFVEVAKRDFPDAMEKTARTIDAATSNVKEFFTTVIGAKVLGPIIQRIGGFIADTVGKMITPQALQKFEAFGLHLDSIIKLFAEVIGQGGAEAGEILQKIADALGIELPNVTLEDVIKGIERGIFGFLTSARDMMAWLNDNPKFIEMFEKFKTTLTKLSDVFAALGLTLPPVKVDLADIANMVFDTVIAGLDGLNTQLTNLADWIKSPDGKETLRMTKEIGIALAGLGGPAVALTALVLALPALIAGLSTALVWVLALGTGLLFLVIGLQKSKDAVGLLKDGIISGTTFLFGLLPMLALWVTLKLGEIRLWLMVTLIDILTFPALAIEGILGWLAKDGAKLLLKLGLIKADTETKLEGMVDAWQSDTIAARVKDAGHKLVAWLWEAMETDFATVAQHVQDKVDEIVRTIEYAATKLRELLGLQAQADGVKHKVDTTPSSPTVAPGTFTPPPPPPDKPQSIVVNINADIAKSVDIDNVAYRTAKIIAQRLA